MEENLEKLDGDEATKLKQKREVDNNMLYMDDEIAAVTNDQQPVDNNVKSEVKSSLTSVELPTKGGSPAFSIHANKVYILYPSLFQDPNIFGRFSIPQNINLDPLPDKTILKTAEDPAAMKIQDFSDNINNPFEEEELELGRRMYRRQAPNPSTIASKTSSKKDEKKRNVETHLTGTIVVLNQDVNEFNRKETY